MSTIPDVFILTIAALLIFFGFLGCILPILPGPPLAFAGLVLLEAVGIADIDNTLLWNLFGITILVTAVDYILPSWMVKRAGASRQAVWGSVIGLLIGLIFLPPLGIIIGPFLGAFIGEYLNSSSSSTALKGGCAALLGFIVGTILKLLLTVYMAYVFVKHLPALNF